MTNMRFVPALMALSTAFAATPLDEYVARADDAFQYRLVNYFEGDGCRVHVLDLISQSWETPQPADRTVWRHWLTVYRPAEVAHSTGLLFITGGSNNDPPPSKADRRLAEAAVLTQSTVAELRMVPNQPLSYVGDDFGPRKEDELIAYNWRKFLDSRDPLWLTRLPMTKAAVRAMDAVESFTDGSGRKVDRFVVAGGSKRGWTAWTTAAVDQRVVGVAPIVIDLLNLRESFIHHYRVYGFWAPAVQDYYREGIMDRFQGPEYDALVEIVEPYSYRDRLTMPKFLINSAGDQFFLPDSSQFYFDDLLGEKHLRYVPNSDHSLRDSDAFENLTTFYEALLNDEPRPSFEWTFEEDGAIRVRTEDRPSEVKLWRAHNPEHRDFRLEAVGKIYESETLAPQSEGVYVGRVQTPTSGFTAYFIELTFPSGLDGRPFKFTTAVRVTPDRYPHEAPVPGRTKVGPRKR